MNRFSKILAGAAICLAPFVMASGSHAATYLGEFAGNDPFPGTNSNFDNSPALAKCDVGSETTDGTLGCATSVAGTPNVLNGWEYNVNADIDEGDGGGSGEAGDAFGRFDLTYTTATTFDWSFDDSAALGGSFMYPSFVSVKQGDSYYVWSISGETSGTIDVSVLGLNAISHVSFYDTTGVPLPAAFWLFGSALVGVGAMGRRRRKKVVVA